MAMKTYPKRCLIVALTLVSSVLLSMAGAETIIKDANGIEYLADQMIIKIKTKPAKGAEKQGHEARRLTSLTQAQASVQSLTGKWHVAESRALFPEIVPPTPKMNLSAAKRAAKQREFEKLGNTFVVKLPPGADVKAAVSDFAKDPQVEYAEPVYVFRLCMIPDDPLFNQQWYLHNTGQYYLEDADIDAPEAWEINQGSANPVIAIIDTGVDLDHPDLVNQIWQNPNELGGDGNGDGCPGWCGFDDDGDGLIDEDSAGRQPGDPGYNNDLVNDDDENGYNDDFSGWNWIDDHNNPQDDHGHGTHCAGIAAADTNNAVGIAGVCPNGKVMALKAFQSSGTASNEDIAKAIEYAYQNGGQVISMSFTLGANSALVRNALELAYSTSVLVAAAGNLPQHSGIRYPAYYSYVVGVGATDVQWDDETSSYKEVIAGLTNTTNADIYAPGVSIRSTLLDDTYASWSGTSMATPIVAGIVGLLVSEKTGGFWGPDLYQGQIINCGEGPVNRINAVSVLSQVPEPRLVLESYTIDDSTGDGDGIPDANETVEFYFTIRNTYGNATGVSATLSTADVMATVIDPNADYGNIGPSTSDDNTGDPITVHISPDAGNNGDIAFNFQADANNGGSGINEEIVLAVQRGTEIGGVFDANTVLTSDYLYIVTSPMLVAEGVTLEIEAGTNIVFDEGTRLEVSGTIRAVGTPFEPIIFTSNAWNPSLASWIGIIINDSADDYNPNDGSGCVFKHCEVSYANEWRSGPDGSIALFSPTLVENCRVSYGRFGVEVRSSGCFVQNCEISEIEERGLAISSPTVARANRIHNNMFNLYFSSSSGHSIIEQNLLFSGSGHPLESGGIVLSIDDPGCTVTVSKNTLIENKMNLYIPPGTHYQGTIEYNNFLDPDNYSFYNNNSSSFIAQNNWWGTTDTTEINDLIFDYYDDFTLGAVDYQPYASEPISSAPGVIALVSIDLGPVLGAGLATFTIEFTAPMDISSGPKVTAGVQEPYTQVSIPGGYIDPNHWQGTLNVTVFTGDGIYHLRVEDAWDMLGIQSMTDTRFAFEIATAGLAGVNLQASGEAGRVDLYYNPVDEPDLAGYNIYRSDISGGPYTKINPAVVVETAYSDYTAPQGITKYYVVTAVRTDFTESDYSDEASAAAQDGTPPDINHTPVIDRDIVGPPGITIQATITDDPGTGVASATLYYKKTSETAYSSLPMNNPSGDLWSQNIPGSAITLEGIDYYITAEDNSAYSDTAYHGTAESPHHIILYTEKCGPLSVPLGPSSQSYCTTDVTIEIHSNDTAGEVTVYRMEANAPNVNEPSLQRHWAIKGLEGSTFSADLIFSYSDAALAAAGLDEANLILRKSADGGHTYEAVHATTYPAGNTIETTYEQTSFSIWTVSEFVCGDFGFSPADIDENCYVDFGDFAILGNQWRQAPGVPSADIAPAGGDGAVDWKDLAVLCDNWLAGR